MTNLFICPQKEDNIFVAPTLNLFNIRVVCLDDLEESTTNEYVARALHDSKYIILELSSQSTDMGYIAHNAIQLGKTVVGVYKKGIKLDTVFFQINSDNWHLFEYSTGEEVFEFIKSIHH